MLVKYIWKCKGSWKSKTLMKNKLQLFALPDVKTYYQPTVNKNLFHWYKGRQVHQWNAKIQRRTHNTNAVHKGGSAKPEEKAFNKELWVNWIFIRKKIKLDLNFTPVINFRWIVHKTIRLMGKHLCDLREGKDFLNKTTVAKHKEKI